MYAASESQLGWTHSNVHDASSILPQGCDDSDQTDKGQSVAIF